MWKRISTRVAVVVLALACNGEPPAASGGPPAGWRVTGGDAGGTRYSPLDEISSDNVEHLQVAWEYHTGDFAPEDGRRRNHSFEATPILVGDALVFCTPHSRIVSLDAETGEERWVFDPKTDLEVGHYNLNCRGIAHWLDPDAPQGAACRERIFVATPDARLVAVDVATGKRCSGFGVKGEVEFWHDVPMLRRNEYGISSPPVLVRDVVVLGSSVSESRRTDMPSGMVHACDARSGAPRWTWDPIPKDPDDPERRSWENGSADRTGGANVWSIASADHERDLVFLPTSSPSPDYYGGERLGDNRYADSVVALRGSTGEVVWHFQTVHHDLWDYDVASQPVLIDLPMPGGSVPAVAQGTKMGHLFFLHRETGVPLFPVEERPVPQTDIPGERTSPTQPFPTWPPALVPQTLGPDEVWGLTPIDRKMCRDLVQTLRNEGVFTPPSFEGSVLYPGPAGGMNWGSLAYDPVRKLLVTNTSRVPNTMQLFAREGADFERDRAKGVSRSEMQGTPYVARFGVLLSSWGIPCNPPPWGAVVALDLAKREIVWESTLGTTRKLAPLGIAIEWGTPNMGGPIATAGGVVFIAAAMDDYLRAFDIETGAELWRADLPAGGQATPMTYRVREDGRQYVVIASGGHSSLRTTKGDSVVAYALP